ncbi:Hypothetical protein RAK1035_1557 [Roseovarius sp. AK1035]|nr:Hypothetical protein RAK1035_1557 [Roseovarius sp. AK1035]
MGGGGTTGTSRCWPPPVMATTLPAKHIPITQRSIRSYTFDRGCRSHTQYLSISW